MVIGFFGPELGLEIAPKFVAEKFFWAPTHNHSPNLKHIESLFGVHGLERNQSALELALLAGQG